MHSVQFDSRIDPDAPGVRKLLLIWQNAQTRRFSRVGRLVFDGQGRYEFTYEPAAIADPDFFPLDEFPGIHDVYTSDSLPAFFANRVMSSGRETYHRYLGWMGLGADDDDLPVELLARTGGSRATDRFHIVEEPRNDADSFTSRFFVSGVRHQAGADARIAIMQGGDQVLIESEPSNPKNADAHMVLRVKGEPIGWVPDWLCSEIAERSREGWTFDAVAEQINHDAPAHIQVLCRIEGHRS